MHEASGQPPSCINHPKGPQFPWKTHLSTFGGLVFWGHRLAGCWGDTTIAPITHGVNFRLGQGHSTELPPTVLHTMSPFIQPRAGGTQHHSQTRTEGPHQD